MAQNFLYKYLAEILHFQHKFNMEYYLIVGGQLCQQNKLLARHRKIKLSFKNFIITLFPFLQSKPENTTKN